MRGRNQFPVLFCSLIALYPISCFGDGCFVWRNRSIDILQPSQKAVIEWDGKTEKLTIQTKYKGPADEMAWIVPVPSKPKVTRACMELFYDMSRATRDIEIMFNGDFFPLNRNQEQSADPLISRQRAGVYDVAVLAPDNGDAAIAWLKANQFPVSEAAAAIIAEYSARHWFTLAIRIPPESFNDAVAGQLAEGALHPLAVSFDTDRCVYPMRMTALASGPVEVLLWIEGNCHYMPETLTGADWDITFYGGPVFPWWHKADIWSLESCEPEHTARCITKMRRTFDPKDLTEDLYLKEADYTACFNPSNARNAAMIASEWGRWRDPRGIPVLTQYLKQTTIEDRPNILSAIWALGLCSGGKRLPPETEELLVTIARTDDEGPGWQSLFSLERSGSPEAGPIILQRMEETLDTLANTGEDEVWLKYMLSGRREALARWFHKHRDSKQYLRYMKRLRAEIKRTTRTFKEGRRGFRRTGLLDDYERWLIDEAEQSRNPSFAQPLSNLRQALVEFKGPVDCRAIHLQSAYILAVMAACQSEWAENELTDLIAFELENLYQNCKLTPAPAIRYEPRRPRNIYDYRPPAIESFDTVTTIACNHLPPAVWEKIALTLLKTRPLGDYNTLFLLGWIPHPEEEIVSEFKTVWLEDKVDDFLVNRALTVAEIWGDGALIRWMIEHCPQLSLAETCLYLLMEKNPGIAAEVLDDFVIVWNKEFSTIDLESMTCEESKTFRFRNRKLQSFVEQALKDPVFEEKYQIVCSDNTLHTTTRLVLLESTGGLGKKRPAWTQPLAESLFNEMVTGASKHQYYELIDLLEKSLCSKRLAEEWVSTQEEWKKIEVIQALNEIGGPEAVKIDAQLLIDMGEQYKSVRCGDFETFISKLWDMFHDIDSHPETEDLFDQFLREEEFDIAYRACVACVVPILTLPEMEMFSQAKLPESISKKLRSRIDELKDREPFEE